MTRPGRVLDVIARVVFIECPECDGRGRYVLTNANDPCASLYVCEECDGNGEIAIEDDADALEAV